MEVVAGREPLKGHVSWRWVDAQLNASRSIWVASTRPDGTPHAMPVWFVWDDTDAIPWVYFITARPTQKARNLARNPSVVLHLGLGDDVVAVHGQAVIVEDAAEIDPLDAAYREKYIEPESGDRASVRDNPLDDKVYRVDVVRLLAWVYGDVGTWTEWRFVPDDSPAELEPAGGLDGSLWCGAQATPEGSAFVEDIRQADAERENDLEKRWRSS